MLTTQALVVVGDGDHNPMFSSQNDWRSDAFHRSPGGNKTLLTLFGAEHMMGGVSGYDAEETTDENPARVAAVRALVWAYLQSALNPGDPAWANTAAALAQQPKPYGRIDSNGPRSRPRGPMRSN